MASLLGLSDRTVYQMVRDGRLPAVRIGGRWRFRPEEIERWLTAEGADRAGRRGGGFGPAAAVQGPAVQRTAVQSPAGRGPADTTELDRPAFERTVGGIEDPLERRLAFVGLLAAASKARGWLPPVVVGGHAVEFYTAGGYATVDIDLVSAHEPLMEVLPGWGFVSRGRHWLHEGLGLVVEAPGSHLEAGQRDRVTRVEVGGGIAHILGVEDVIVDRLAACVHWRSEEDCGWARVLLGLFAGRLDLDYLLERARAQEVEARLSDMLEAEGSASKDAPS